MKSIFILLITFIFLTPFYGQQKNGVAIGSVVNAKTKEAIPFVTITVKNPKQKAFAISDDNGKFALENLTQTRYVLKIEALGYKVYKKSIVLKTNNYIDLQIISLEESAEVLKAVVVRAETSVVQQKVDRIVVNVGKDLTSAGTDAASVLNNIQSVSVDQQTGELSLRGNTNVRVLVDGKPTNIPTDQLLQQLPSNAIKNIEVITNPSAKYNPEGNSGIINIELIKNIRKGINGSVNASTTIGRNVRGNQGVNINYKKDNVNWFANYNYRGGKSDILGGFERINNSSQTYGLNDKQNHFFKIGADVDLTKKTSISLYTLQSINKLKYSNTTSITALPSNIPLNENNFSLVRKPHSQTYNIDVYHAFNKKKHTLNYGISYNLRNAPETSTTRDALIPNDGANNFFENIDDNSKRVLINLDYTKPFGRKASLEAGLEYRTYQKNKDNFSNQVVQNLNNISVPRNNSDFEVNRAIYSAYFNYKQQFNKLGIQIGLRGESYNLKANFIADVNNQNEKITDLITSLYPSAFLTYKVTNKDQLQASYSRRVDRPSPRQLTPIRTWGTPLITSRGNPELKQQFTNSFELKYNRKVKGGNIALTGFYRIIDDFISRALSRDILLTERIVLSYDNFGTTNNYGLELATYLKFKRWWQFNASTDLYFQKQKGLVNGLNTEIDNLLFNFRINNNFKLSPKLNIQVFNMYRGKDKNVQRVRDAMFMTNIATSYKILKNKGTLTLGVSDIFNSFRARFAIKNPIQQRGEFNWESQRITFGFVYSFGKKIKRKKKRKTTQESNSSDGIF